ncbi:phosphate acetyltransferase [Burkholderia oklahomensis]|uniref:Phosphate acetyltransferase n=2 Tax=Burkholderia oklahomensis TaxID=342113 RepID=A0AAI8BEA0_9BURK|nr:phosphate acetyltransferase [Burkholderia oklahomensis]AIO70439.1 phosphate acetyltransferase [Burkholderia oklahomensis]AOI38859.1 phosphate acetyltransferase [Burkholderia oklahomensis EO147]KUY65564.1 phosphate acetyltransferase [Burkholderia oklahomensis EO147]QPS40797.1 phosphate acetyltransferase [Burkholderia oklahomensis]
MNVTNLPRTFYLVPVSHDAGLTSMALGLVRSLQLAGVRVGFVKPIAQPEASTRDRDLSSHFARTLCGTTTPEPIPFAHAAEMVREGCLAGLMEEVVAIVESAREGNHVMIVEGLIPYVDAMISTRLNIEMIRSMGADLVPVVTGGTRGATELAAIAAGAAEQYSNGGRRPLAGVLINRCRGANASALGKLTSLHLERSAREVPILAAVPTNVQLTAPRLIDVAAGLDLTVFRSGDIETARVENFVVAARSPEKLIPHFKSGTLVVMPVDRSDAILAVAFTALRGMPLAGLILTCGGEPDPEAIKLLEAPPLDRLPVLLSDEDTFTVASRLTGLSSHVFADDAVRMERVLDFIAGNVHVEPLVARLDAPVETLMPPPVFRHRLVGKARLADRRIVLPEGDEPRTIHAAVICAEKGIARPMLLGAPDTIRSVAAGHGIELPKSVEILDPETIRDAYVEPMVDLRKSKGLTALQAAKQLEDTVVLGTMMLARGDVDGLVSGAVHTTANTVRPALQLIRAAPGNSVVSSVFFMLMPDQVLVYGDCAINPDPSAEELAEIAIQSADSAKAFGIDPRVAMISYSTGSSGSGDDVEKVRAATALVRERRPDLVIDGPMQYDAATVEAIGKQKAPGSPVAGRANVCIFPDLNTGNTTYKAVQRSANVVSVGPMLQGLRKPVNDLSRGALVDDIVYTIALTAIQAAAGGGNPNRAVPPAPAVAA